MGDSPLTWSDTEVRMVHAATDSVRIAGQEFWKVGRTR